MASVLPSPRPHPWFDTTATPAAKLRTVAAQSRLTWPDYFTICWSYSSVVPLAMRRAIAERLDVMSAPYEETVRLPNDESFGVAGLLRVLLKPRSKERELWTLLFARATDDGRRRLVEAYGDTEDEGGGYGSVWSPDDWPRLAALYAPGTPGSGPLDVPQAWTLIEIFETHLHWDDPSAAPGELWARAVADSAEVSTESYLARRIAGQAKWFLADPARLSDVAVSTLLNSSSAVVRTWVMTDVVPRRQTPAPEDTAARATPAPRRPRRPR